MTILELERMGSELSSAISGLSDSPEREEALRLIREALSIAGLLVLENMRRPDGS